MFSVATSYIGQAIRTLCLGAVICGFAMESRADPAQPVPIEVLPVAKPAATARVTLSPVAIPVIVVPAPKKVQILPSPAPVPVADKVSEVSVAAGVKAMVVEPPHIEEGVAAPPPSSPVAIPVQRKLSEIVYHGNGLGIHAYTLSNEICVLSVEPGSAAAASGMAANDIILSIDGATLDEEGLSVLDRLRFPSNPQIVIRWARPHGRGERTSRLACIP